MAVKILTCNSEYESACRLGFPTKTHYGDYAYKSDGDIVIRWGNSVSVFERGGKEVEFQQVINPSKAIKLNCQKHKATKAMALVVNVPTLYEKSVPKDVLAVIRPIEHSAGVGFSVQKGPLQIQKGTYGTRYLKTDAEYRVWFCGNRTMCGRRVKMKINETQEFPCRSNWGYEFSDGIAPELHYQTLMVANKIGLETGAADVLFYKRKYYFLELNSAPSVDHRIVREFFQKALNELIEAEAPKPAEPEKKVPFWWKIQWWSQAILRRNPFKGWSKCSESKRPTQEQRRQQWSESEPPQPLPPNDQSNNQQLELVDRPVQYQQTQSSTSNQQCSEQSQQQPNQPIQQSLE